MAVIDVARLKKYLSLNYNVILSGAHGVGKTESLKQVFEGENLRWKYFSASTLDPWVDFVGTPKAISRPGKSDVLGLVRPQYIEDDEIDAIFFDEFNRAPDKVINAVMELIQFKSINGHKLKNLRVIWAAINPSDEEETYAVNHLDPAQLDRFHVKIAVPFEVDDEYFKAKYPETGEYFIKWWRDIPMDIRKEISPRRLDYAADAWKNDCRLEDFLPNNCNVKKLRAELRDGDFVSSFANITDENEAKKFLKSINNTTKLVKLFKEGNVKAADFLNTYKSCFPKDLLSSNGVDGGVSVDKLSDFLGDQGMLQPSNKSTGMDLQTVFNQLANSTLDINLVNSKIDMTPYHLITALQNDMRAFDRMYPAVIGEVASITANYLVSASVKNLQALLWKPGSADIRSPTPMFHIIKCMNDMNKFGAGTVNKINKRLYSLKVVSSMHFL